MTGKRDCGLVGELCLERPIRKEIVSSTMEKTWKVGKPFFFREIYPNMLVITFANQADKQRVLEGKPWLFDNNLFVLQPFDGFTQPHPMSYDFETF